MTMQVTSQRVTLPVAFAVTLLIVSLMASLSGMGQVRVGAAHQMRPDSNGEIAMLYFDDVHNQAAYTLTSSLVAADAMIHTPDRELRGPDGVNDFLRTLRTSFPDAQFVVQDMVVGDEAVTVRWTLVGTNLGAYGNLPASGGAISMEGISILRFANGMIVEAWAQYDRLALRQAIQLTLDWQDVRVDYDGPNPVAGVQEAPQPTQGPGD